MYKCALCDSNFYTQMDFKVHQHGIHPIPAKKGSIEDIYIILQFLQVLLEKIIAMLRKCGLALNKKKKQVDCCKYLNKNYGRLEYTYDEWCDTITGSKDDFKCLFSEDIDSSIIQMIKRHSSDLNTTPIRCFNIKNNKFYIYGNDHKWCKMHDKHFLKLYRLCSGKISMLYKEWVEENDNVGSDEWVRITQKITPNDDKIRKIVKKNLFNHLKHNVSAMVEIELC